MRRSTSAWALAIALVVTLTVTGCSSESAVDPADFSAIVDNFYLPLSPGASRVYEGSSEEGATRVTVTVLLESRVVLGVKCRVVLDQVFVKDELRESTRGWYAQDAEGNVWSFGEAIEQYKGGKVIDTAGSWEAGVEGAAPGIVMKAEPTVGDVYPQEYLAGEAGGMAEVLEVDATVEVPYSSFRGVVKIKEWTPLDPGVIEEKYYAPGMGLVLTEQVEGGSDWGRLIHLFGLCCPQ